MGIFVCDIIELSYFRGGSMSTEEILRQALKLKPEERFILVEGLLKSIDEPDENIDALWVEESEKRLKAYRDGRLEAYSMDEIFKERQAPL